MRHVAVKWIDGIVLVRPHHLPDGLWGGRETDELHKVLETLNHEKAQHVIVNLAEVKFMMTRALSVLVMAHKRFAERGAEIRLSNLCDKIDQIFVVTRLCMVFDVHETEKEAIESFLAERGEAKPTSGGRPSSKPLGEESVEREARAGSGSDASGT